MQKEELIHPLVTVLMPLYNTEKYIGEAVESILNQTYTNFEFIIIDDASTDNSVAIVQSYQDSRIQLIVKPQNTGLTVSLNMGLKLAKGKYIARMDSDDISVLNRLATQVAFMEANADVAVCGSWFQYINKETIIQHPEHHYEIKVALLSYCAIGHPTVMLRNEFLQQHQLTYNTEMEPAEDYALWAKISCLGKLANLPDVLLQYRVHENQVSSVRSSKQYDISNKIRMDLLMQLLPNNPIDYSLFQYSAIEGKDLFEEVNDRVAILDKLQEENNRKDLFNRSLFNTFLFNLKQSLVTAFFHDNRAFNIKNLTSFLSKGRHFSELVSMGIVLKYCFKSFVGFQKKAQQ